MKHVIRIAYAIALAMVVSACGSGTDTPARSQERASRAHAAPSFRGPHRPASAGTGFRSRAELNRHFARHGAEFGRVTEAHYLREAQALRDAPVGGTVKESSRPDGTPVALRPGERGIHCVRSGWHHPDILQAEHG